jgi:hypothetical protein
MPINSWIESGDVVEPERGAMEQAFYTELDAEVLVLDHLFVGGSVETQMSWDRRSFSPNVSIYEFRAGLRFDMVEFGVRHVCGPHPVHSYPMIQGLEDVAPFEGAYEKVFVRFGSKRR